MNCEDMKVALIGLIHGEIDEPDRRLAEDHLARCGICREDRERLEEVSRLLRSQRAEEDAEGFLFAGRTAAGRAPRRAFPVSRLALRYAAAAALLLVAPLVILAAANTRIQKDSQGWAVQFSLLPRAQGGVSPGAERLTPEEERRIQAEIDSRLVRHQQELLAALDERINQSRRLTLADLARALATQEETFSAGIRSEREQSLRRSDAVEAMLGSELTRTQQMLGVVLAASQPPQVIEQ